MAKINKPDMTNLWASQGAVIAPSGAKIQQGWTAEIPPHQWENYVQLRQDTYLAYIGQQGIPEWDATTEYQAGTSFVQYGSKIYLSLTTNTNSQPDINPTDWQNFVTSGLPTGTVGGTADALTVTFTETVTLDNGASIVVRANSANASTTPTLDIGTGAVTIVKGNNTPLLAGDIAGAGHWLQMQYDTALTKWVLMNPALGVSSTIAKTGFNQTFTKAQRGAETALPATTGTVTLVMSAGNNFSGTLTGNITLANPTDIVVGQSGVIKITNGATPYTIAYGSYFKATSGAMPALTAAANAVDLIPYYVESPTRIWIGIQGDVK